MSTTLVLGGIRTGETRQATRLLSDHPAVTVIRAGGSVDDGSSARIHGPREAFDLPQGWTVAESPDVTRTILRSRTPVLVDCLGSWVLGLLDGADAWGDRAVAIEVAESAAYELAALWSDAPFDCVAVSHEVAMAPLAGDEQTAIYQEALGRVNTIVGSASNTVQLLIAGRVLDLSAAPPAH